MSSDDKKRKIDEIFGQKKFDVESSINLYATGFVVFPAFAIYEDGMLSDVMDQIKRCHIYFVGLLPKIDIVGSSQVDDTLIINFTAASKNYDLRWKLPAGHKLEGDGETGWYILAPDGTKSFPSEHYMMSLLNEKIKPVFKVLYIGQAFGDDGSRNALDRLRKHETLQKISIKGIPNGYVLTLLLFETLPSHRMVMMINPFAKDTSQGDARIDKMIDKMKNTTDDEKITLYEASMIRYFAPPFNKEFKDSFPSTRMKVLADCYEKDIASVTAEISIDEMPFRIGSDTIAPRQDHIAHHDLHKSEDRKVFFLNK